MKPILKFAFFKTVPVLLGYLFLGMAFGLLLQKNGYSAWWAFFISLIVYAGSMQFVMLSFLDGGTSFITVGVMTLLINSRHAFYGLTFVEKFRQMKTYPYMVFSLTDETYSLLCSAKIPDDLDENKTLFCISFFDQCYWVIGSVIGGIIGGLITFNSTGIDFAMTALFVVIFIEQWLEAKSHTPAIIGLVSGLVCLMVFGPSTFILPSLIITVTLLIALREVTV